MGHELFDWELYPNAQHNLLRDARGGAPESESDRQRSAFRAVVSALELLNPDAEAMALEFERDYAESGLALDLRLRVADHFFKLRRYDKSRKWYQGVDRRLISGTQKDEIDFKIAYSHFMNEDAVSARPLFEKVSVGSSEYAGSAAYYLAYLDYTEGQYAKAGAAFERMKSDPQFGAVVPYYLAQIYYKTGRYDELMQTGNSLLERPDAVRASEIERLLADAYYRKENYVEAAVHLERFIEKGGKPLETDRFQLGYSYYKSQRYGEAREHFNKIAGGSGPLQQQAWYHLGDCYLNLGTKNEALNAFKASAALDQSPELQRRSAYLAAKLGYELSDPIDDPVARIQDYLKKYPDPATDRELNGLLADLYLNRRDYLKAMEALEKAGNDSPELKAAYQQVAFYRAVELFNAQEFPKSIETFGKSQQQPAKPLLTALAYYWMAEARFKMGQYADAVSDYERFRAHPGAASSSEYMRSEYDLAFARFKKKDYAAAGVGFRAYADRKSGSPALKADARLRAGDCHYMQGEFASALGQYQKSAEGGGRDMDYALLQLANCQGLTGKTDDKIRTLHRLSTEFPQSRFAAEAQYERGASYLTSDRPAEALAAFEQFERSYPAHPLYRSAMLNRAVALRNLGKTDQALGVAKKLVSEAPSTQEAREAISLVRRMYSDLGEVDAYVDWVGKLNMPDVAESALDSTLYNGAYDRYASGDDAAALRQFDAYRNRFPKGLFLRNALRYSAEVRERQGLHTEAERDWKALYDLGPGASYDQACFALGASAFKSGKNAEARRYFEALRSTAHFVLIRDSRAYMLRMEAVDNPQTAVILAGEILSDERSKPEDRTEARLVRARSLDALGQAEVAAADYRILYAEPKGASAAEAGIRLAQGMLKSGDAAKAVEQVYETLSRHPAYREWKEEGFLVLIDAFFALNDLFQAEYLIDHLEKNASGPAVAQRAAAARVRLKAMQTPPVSAEGSFFPEGESGVDEDADALNEGDEEAENPAETEAPQ